MPYDQLEEIQSRRNEKIAMFLTLENAFGMILVAFPAYLVSVGMPFVLRVAIVVAAATLGVVATLNIGGLTFYERLIWTTRGAIRRRIQGDRIRPAQLVGATAATRTERPLPRGGPIRRRNLPPLAGEPVVVSSSAGSDTP